MFALLALYVIIIVGMNTVVTIPASFSAQVHCLLYVRSYQLLPMQQLGLIISSTQSSDHSWPEKTQSTKNIKAVQTGYRQHPWPQPTPQLDAQHGSPVGANRHLGIDAAREHSGISHTRACCACDTATCTPNKAAVTIMIE
jgi:hypothetical protein